MKQAVSGILPRPQDIQTLPKKSTPGALPSSSRRARHARGHARHIVSFRALSLHLSLSDFCFECVPSSGCLWSDVPPECDLQFILVLLGATTVRKVRAPPPAFSSLSVCLPFPSVRPSLVWSGPAPYLCTVRPHALYRRRRSSQGATRAERSRARGPSGRGRSISRVERSRVAER